MSVAWIALVVVLVALALAGALWRLWRSLLIRPGDVLSVGGMERRVSRVDPWNCLVTLDEPFDHTPAAGDHFDVRRALPEEGE
jgi:hypothetical protein